ncbi:MAG: O-antigen ligase family protein [Flavobacteriales bacterium]|nr:O-antigen ligase family protein [Flavobacteriales bacterium]
MSSPIERHIWLLAFIAFFIPVYQPAVPFLLLFFLLHFLANPSLRRFPEFKLWSPPTALMAFYIFHLLGLIWSDNKSFGFFDLEVKLSLLLVPLVFLFCDNIAHRHFEKIISFYIYGCISAVLIGVVNSLYMFYTGRNPIFNMYDVNISPVLHLGYFAMYLNMGLVLVIYKVITSEDKFYSVRNALLILSSFVLAFAIFLSTSRNGFMVFILMLLLILIYSILKYKRWTIWLTVVLLAWVTASSLLKDMVGKSKSLHGFDKVKTVLEAPKVDKNTGESTASRILVWQSALEIMAGTPVIGVGTGDIKDALLDRYKANGFTAPYARRYNAHNQYLQTGAALGVIGLLLFVLFIALNVFGALRIGDFLSLLFAVNLSVACLTESILEVQAGVVFTAFFTVILYYSHSVRLPVLNRKLDRTNEV